MDIGGSSAGVSGQGDAVGYRSAQSGVGGILGLAIIAVAHSQKTSGLGSTPTSTVYFRTWGVADRLEQSAILKRLLREELSAVSEERPSIFGASASNGIVYACLRRGPIVFAAAFAESRTNETFAIDALRVVDAVTVELCGGAAKFSLDALNTLRGKLVVCLDEAFPMGHLSFRDPEKVLRLAKLKGIKG